MHSGLAIMIFYSIGTITYMFLCLDIKHKAISLYSISMVFLIISSAMYVINTQFNFEAIFILSYLFFSLSIYVALMAIDLVLEINNFSKVSIFFISLILINLFLSIIGLDLTLFIIKVMFMLLFCLYGLIGLRRKYLNRYERLLSCSLTILPLFQIVWFILANVLYLKIYFWDILEYFVQSAIFALLIAFVLMECEKKQLELKLVQAEEIALESQLNDKTKTEYYASISHEFRTPVNVIYSTVQLIESKLKNSTQEIKSNDFERYFSSIRSNCSRILQLVNHVIDMDKLQCGLLELELSRCNILEVIENVIININLYASTQGKQVELCCEQKEIISYFDKQKIESIILNLLSNSIKYSYCTNCITVGVEQINREVCITITDTGVGMSDDQKQKLYKRFITKKSDNENVNSSGIGLQLVKAFVDMHKGDIRLDTDYTCGCRFIITLPLNDEVRSDTIA